MVRFGFRLYLGNAFTYSEDWKGVWHRLGHFPIRSTFHHFKRGKRNIESFTCYVFYVFNCGKWYGLGNDLAYVARLFKSFSGIYCAPLYIEAFSRYKCTTERVENGTFWFSAYILETLLRTADIDISTNAFQKGRWHRLGHFSIRFAFHHFKRGKWNRKFHMFRFLRF